MKEKGKTMEYEDSIILHKREEEKKKKYSTLETGFYLDGRIIKFQRENIYNSFSICLPDNITKMPEEYARIKYPSEFRPGLIFTTMDLKVNMGFTVLPYLMTCEEMEPLAEHMRRAIHRANPDYLIYPSEVLEKNAGVWFAFRSHAMDSDIYNMMLVIPVGKQTLQGSFNCPYQEYGKWKKMVKLMWESIEEK